MRRVTSLLEKLVESLGMASTSLRKHSSRTDSHSTTSLQPRTPDRPKRLLPIAAGRETTTAREKILCGVRIRSVLQAAPFPDLAMSPLDPAVLDRAIDRITADSRLCSLLTHLDDEDALRRTLLSLYYRALYDSR